MIALVVFALVGAASAQFGGFPQQQFASQSGLPGQSSFASSDAQLLPPVFPVSQTRGAPQRPIAPQAPLPVQRSFATPLASQAGVPVSRPIQFDSSSFVDSGAHSGFNAQRNQPAITVLDRKEVIDPSGQYSSSFRDSAGSSADEQGYLKPTNDRLDNVVAKQGQYSYIDPEGKQHLVTYTADEYGFHPSSHDIPVQGAAIVPTF